jgi:uncharacterized protein
MDDWRAHLIDDAAGIARLLAATRRVAVLGIKTEAQALQPAFYVARYLHDAGLDVVPVPVYYPDVATILGKPVYRRIADIPGAVDLVDVFRRPQDLAPHLDDLLAARPRAVWLQSGIRHEGFAHVVQDRCLMVDHRSHARARA